MTYAFIIESGISGRGVLEKRGAETADYGYLDSQIKAVDLFLEDQRASRNLIEAYKWEALAVNAKPDDTD